MARQLERNPDSVLVSLRSLRRMEEERVEREISEERRAEAERRAATEEAERREREEQARREREEAERRRQAEERREQAEREERYRLAEATQRARVEAELALERERLALTLASRPPAKRIGLALTSTLSALLAAALVVTLVGWSRTSALLDDGAQALGRSREELRRSTREIGLLLARLTAGEGRVTLLEQELERARRIQPLKPAPPKPPPVTPGTRLPHLIQTSCGNKDDPIDCLDQAPGGR